MVESYSSKLYKSIILTMLIIFMQSIGLGLYAKGYLFWGYFNWIISEFSIYFLSCKHFGLELFGIIEKKEVGK